MRKPQLFCFVSFRWAELLERKCLKKLRKKELKEKEQGVNVESIDSGLSSTDFGEEGSLTVVELSPSSSSFEHDLNSQEQSGDGNVLDIHSNLFNWTLALIAQF